MTHGEGLLLPIALTLKLGDLIQTAADFGVFTGDHDHVGGDAGGRIYAGGLDPTIGDSTTSTSTSST